MGSDEDEKIKIFTTLIDCSTRLQELGVDINVEYIDKVWRIREWDILSYNPDDNEDFLVSNTHDYPNVSVYTCATRREDVGEYVVFPHTDYIGEHRTVILLKNKEVK